MKLTNEGNPQTPDPGIHRGVTWEVYRGWNCFSKSMVGAALTSGRHLEHYVRDKTTTSGMTLGSLVDTLLLEPDMYSTRYAVQPSTYKKEVTRGRGAKKVTTEEERPFNPNSHTCQRVLSDLRGSGKCVIKQNQYEFAREIVAAIRGNDRAAEIVDRCDKQVSVVWVDPHSGVLCKGRPDLYDAEAGEIWDLKTTVDASPQGFPRLLTRFGYHVQGGAYCSALKTLTGKSHSFGIVAAETSERTHTPQTAIYRIDDVSLMAGYVKFNRALKCVAVWQDSGISGYSAFVEPISALYWDVENELSGWDGGELEL